MSSKTTTSEELVLAYGDFNAGNGYVIADRVGMSIELIPHLFGTEKRPTGQRGTYAYWRVGGAPVVDNAVRLLEVK
jgi:HK97 family phage major capsid protein